MSLRITVWNEFIHEKREEGVKAIYPDGIHMAIQKALRTLLPEATVRTATQPEPEHGLSDAVLDATDVLIWWGHMGHADVSDAVVDRAHKRVLAGMGAIFLHSAHYSKLFIKLMGTGCGLHWREIGERERLFVVDPSHPIADGLPPHFDIEHEEMYGEFFDVPPPEELVMISWFQGGNVFRSCATWRRGKGRVAYIRPGHETYPTYHRPEIQRVIANAATWAACKSSQQYSMKSPRDAVPLSPLW